VVPACDVDGNRIVNYTFQVNLTEPVAE